MPHLDDVCLADRGSLCVHLNNRRTALDVPRKEPSTPSGAINTGIRPFSLCCVRWLSARRGAGPAVHTFGLQQTGFNSSWTFGICRIGRLIFRAKNGVTAYVGVPHTSSRLDATCRYHDRALALLRLPPAFFGVPLKSEGQGVATELGDVTRITLRCVFCVSVMCSS